MLAEELEIVQKERDNVDDFCEMWNNLQEDTAYIPEKKTYGLLSECSRV